MRLERMSLELRYQAEAIEAKAALSAHTIRHPFCYDRAYISRQTRRKSVTCNSLHEIWETVEKGAWAETLAHSFFTQIINNL